MRGQRSRDLGQVASIGQRGKGVGHVGIAGPAQ
jgi:hypothetical protein